MANIDYSVGSLKKKTTSLQTKTSRQVAMQAFSTHPNGAAGAFTGGVAGDGCALWLGKAAEMASFFLALGSGVEIQIVLRGLGLRKFEDLRVDLCIW